MSSASSPSEPIIMSHTPVILRDLVDDVTPPPPSPPLKISMYVMHDATYREPAMRTPGGFRYRDKNKPENSRTASGFSDVYKKAVDSQEKSRFASTEAENSSLSTKPQPAGGSGFPVLFETGGQFATRTRSKFATPHSTHSFFALNPEKGLLHKSPVPSGMATNIDVAQSYQVPGVKGKVSNSLFNLHVRPISIEHYETHNTPANERSNSVCSVPVAPADPSLGTTTGSSKARGSFPQMPATGSSAFSHKLSTASCLADIAKGNGIGPSRRPTKVQVSRNTGLIMKRKFISTAVEAQSSAAKQLFGRSLDAKGKKRLIKEYSGRQLDEFISPNHIGSINDVADAYDNLVNWNLARMYRSIGDRGELRINPPEMPVPVSLSKLNDVVLGNLMLLPAEVVSPENSTRTAKKAPPPAKYPVSPRRPSEPKAVAGTFQRLASLYESMLNAHETTEEEISATPDLGKSCSLFPQSETVRGTKAFHRRYRPPQINRSSAMSRETAIMREKVNSVKEKYHEVQVIAEKCDNDLMRKRYREIEARNVDKIFKEKPKADSATLIRRYYKVKKLMLEDHVDVVNMLNHVVRRRPKERVKPLLDTSPVSVNAQMKTQVSRERTDAYLSRLFHEEKKNMIKVRDAKLKTTIHKLI